MDDIYRAQRITRESAEDVELNSLGQRVERLRWLCPDIRYTGGIKMKEMEKGETKYSRLN